jgi:hypothetical protein
MKKSAGKKNVKPAVKKPAIKAKKVSGAQNPSRKKGAGLSNKGSLQSQKLKKLVEIAELMNNDDLSSLIRQAEILVYNRKLLEDFNTAKIRMPAAVSHDDEKIIIKEADDLRYFLVYIRRYQNFFTRDEMRIIARHCHEAADKIDAARRLYSWLERERLDVVRNSMISGPLDTVLIAFYDIIRKNYIAGSK